MSDPMIRKLQQTDLDQIVQVQSECYTEVEPESRSSLQSKIKLSENICWVAERSGQITAYLLCHP